MNRTAQASISILTLVVAVGLLAGAAAAATHTVNQVNLTFDPDEITINVGDTVEWIWSSGIHTVTNGLDLADPDLGTLFDEPLTAANPVVSYTFTAAGDVPYLCRPHVTLGMTGVVHVLDPTAAPGLTPVVAVRLEQNAPNPFNPRTEISFVLADAASGDAVSLEVFDLRGRLVTSLLQATLPAGRHSVEWNGRDGAGRAVASGTYVYRLQVGDQVTSRPMVLAR